jgi:hypothetical protein
LTPEPEALAVLVARAPRCSCHHAGPDRRRQAVHTRAAIAVAFGKRENHLGNARYHQEIVADAMQA